MLHNANHDLLFEVAHHDIITILKQSPLPLFSLFSAGFNTKELITQYSAVFLPSLVMSQLVKKGPYEDNSNLSVPFVIMETYFFV